MFAAILANLGNIIIIVILVAAIGLALRSVLKKRKSAAVDAAVQGAADAAGALSARPHPRVTKRKSLPAAASRRLSKGIFW